MRLPIGEGSLCSKEMWEVVGRGEGTGTQIHQWASEWCKKHLCFIMVFSQHVLEPRARFLYRPPRVNPAANGMLMFLLSPGSEAEETLTACVCILLCAYVCRWEDYCVGREKNKRFQSQFCDTGISLSTSARAKRITLEWKTHSPEMSSNTI